MSGDYMLQLEADIIPDESLGGLLLRTPIKEMLTQTNAPSTPLKGRASFEALFQVGGGVVQAAADTRTGRVFRLSAYKGYQGKLFGAICVGMKVREAMSADARLYYDETEEVVLCRGVEGVALELLEIDPPLDLVPGMEIHAITVYAKEIRTAAGQEGLW